MNILYTYRFRNPDEISFTYIFTYDNSVIAILLDFMYIIDKLL